jgi:dipeptidase E
VTLGPSVMQAFPRRILAIGGGGFLMDDPRGLQERYLVSLCRTATPKALYLGTASGDSERAQLKFMKAFTALGCVANTLPFFPYEMKRDYVAEVMAADLIYVGGGNTPAMLAVWREFGFDRALRQANEAGTVLAGISAGANCWFENYITDSVPGGGSRPGLGWLPGTFCPHLDSEAWRQPMLQATPGRAVGAGENVAVLYENEVWVEAVSSAPGTSTAMCWRRHADETLAPCEPRALQLSVGAT